MCRGGSDLLRRKPKKVGQNSTDVDMKALPVTLILAPGTITIRAAHDSAPGVPIDLCAPFTRAKALFMVAPDDEMVHANYNVTRKTFDLIRTQKEWYDIRDGHFGLLYYPSERFDEASRVQVGYLQKQLDA